MRTHYATYNGYTYSAGYSYDFPYASTLGKIERQATENAMAPLARWYGVSTGNGNDGVSHMFPSFYVWTNDPWTVAERNAQSDIKAEFHDEIEVDGEADYTVSASLYDPDCEYYSYICEVFPVELDEVDAARADPWGKFCYGSLSEAFGE